MRMVRNTKIAALLLGLILTLGSANFAKADCGRHEGWHSRSFLGLTVNLGTPRDTNYYLPCQGGYTYYPDYYSYQMAIRKLERQKREIAMKERYLDDQMRAESYGYVPVNYSPYYRY